MPDAAQAGRAPTVMLVDGEPDGAADIGAVLAAAGFAPVAEHSAADAFMNARRRPPDAIVAGTALDDLNGYALCSLCRCDPLLGAVPVVLITNDVVDAEHRGMAACAGAAALVERTAGGDAIAAAVHAAVARGTPLVHATDACGRLRRETVEYLGNLLVRMRRSELRYRAILEHAREGIVLLTPTGTIVDANRWWEETAGIARDALIGHHISEFVPPADRQEHTEGFLRLVGAGGGLSPIVDIRRRDGSTLHMQFSTARVTLDGDDLVLSIARDVTETVAARRELEASERKYRWLVESIPPVVWTSTPDGRITFVSAKIETVSGYSSAEIVAGGGSLWIDRIHPSDVEGVRAELERFASERQLDTEYRWQRKDGEWIWVRTRAMAAPDMDGNPQVHGVLLDITEHRRLADQLRQSQKMEAIGQLTSGIAHDFNNLLAVILGNAQLLLDELPKDDPRRPDAAAVIDAGERAASLTRQLLMFSRRQIVRPEPLDVNEVLSGLEAMLRRLIGEDIHLQLDLTDTPATVVADRGEIEQIVLNLAVNARDAMPDGGRLTITTTNAVLDCDYAALHHGVAAGAYVMLAVTDSGCGIDAAIQQRIFEPFFTTKDKSRGTGLGLSTCWAIVHHWRGHIAVYSEPGQGSSFTVYLPRHDRAPANATAATADDGPGTGTILLVEDDAALRRTIHRALAIRGYQVLDAVNGKDAIRIADTRPEPIDLVLCDMVMPGLNGPDTVAEVRRRRPAMTVLFMSGYSDHPLLRSGSASRVDFIQKPFTASVLARRVKDALLRARGASGTPIGAA